MIRPCPPAGLPAARTLWVAALALVLTAAPALAQGGAAQIPVPLPDTAAGAQGWDMALTRAERFEPDHDGAARAEVPAAEALRRPALISPLRPVEARGRPTGSALRFDGVNDYVQVNNSGALSPQFLTVAGWVKPTTFSNVNWNSMLVNLGTHDWTNGYFGLAIRTSGAPVAMLNIGGGSSNAYYLDGPVLPVGQWRHLAMTYDNATLKLYVNGTLAA